MRKCCGLRKACSPKDSNELRPASHGRFAGDERSRNAVAKGRIRQFLRRRAIGVHKNRRNALRLVLAFRLRNPLVEMHWPGSDGSPEDPASCCCIGCASTAGTRQRAVSSLSPAPLRCFAGRFRQVIGHAISATSSGDPGLIRRPPAWGIRFVGLRNSRDCDGFARSTSMPSELPKASISAGVAFASGKCNLAPEATPSGLWHIGQAAAFMAG
jgi:hypothetical protein